MTDRARVEALLAATSKRYMELLNDGLDQAGENFWLGKISGIRACLSFMDPNLRPIEEPESVNWS